jgi:hypothetical protein
MQLDLTIDAHFQYQPVLGRASGKKTFKTNAILTWIMQL